MMSPELKFPKADEQAEIVEYLRARERLFFVPGEIIQSRLDTKLYSVLVRLSADGAIRQLPVSEPAFLFIPEEYREAGLPPIDRWLDDFMKHLGQDYYVGLLSAAEVLHSSKLTPSETQVVTTKHVAQIESKALRVRFFQQPFVPTELMLPKHRGSFRISGPALTAVDLVAHVPCSLALILSTLRNLAPSITRGDLRRALDSRSTSTVQRLGFLLDRSGKKKLAQVAMEWLIGKTLSVVPLDANDGPGDVDPKWSVLVNAAF